MTKKENQIEAKEIEIADSEGKQATANSQHQPETESKSTLLRNIQIVLAGMGLFGALTYFLGRLYVESYYSSFGISTQALSFKPEDYMFFSFDLIILCVVVAIFIYVYQLFGRLDINFWKAIFEHKNKSELITTIFVSIGILIIVVFSFANVFLGLGYTVTVPGALGLQAGYIIGIVLLIIIWYAKYTAYSESRGLIFIQIIILVVCLAAYLPYTTSKLADVRMASDLNHLPKIIVIYEDDLPVQLQLSPQTTRESVTVRLITINNEMVYLFKDEDFTSESPREMPDIYVIHLDEIDYLIYLQE